MNIYVHGHCTQLVRLLAAIRVLLLLLLLLWSFISERFASYDCNAIIVSSGECDVLKRSMDTRHWPEYFIIITIIFIIPRPRHYTIIIVVQHKSLR